MKELLKKYIYKITAPNYKQVSRDLSELLWANIYHDTIQDKEWAKKVAISPYDMAINYSMLYLLTRILCEYKINHILEFGLGQSSKFINAYLELVDKESKHHIVEHDKEWIEFFSKNITSKSTIKQLNLIKLKLESMEVQLFENLNQHIDSAYNLYLIDGPHGLPNFSRYDICIIANTFKIDDQFIIIMDDCERNGEQETMMKLRDILNNKGIKFYTKVFKGSKSQMMLVTDKYKFATTF
jgi:hypothetical protein